MLEKQDRDTYTGFCVLGAIQQAIWEVCPDLVISHSSGDIMTGSLATLYKECIGITMLAANNADNMASIVPFDISVWNDADNNTQEEVVRVLRTSAKLSEDSVWLCLSGCRSVSTIGTRNKNPLTTTLKAGIL